MTETVRALREEYLAALRAYLGGATEVALARAYEVGRGTTGAGSGVLDVATMHQEALRAVLSEAIGPEEILRRAVAAGDFFAEALAPFEMTHRGFREVNDALRKANETLEQQVAERTRAIERQLERLGALRAIDVAISASLDLRVTLSILLDQVASQLHVDAAGVLLLNPSTDTLEHVAGRGFRSHAIAEIRLQLGEGLAGRAVLERRVLTTARLPEVREAAGRVPVLEAEGFVTCFAAPLVAKGQVRGVLEIFHRTPLDPDHEWLDFLDTLAGQAAIAIDNASLFNGLQRANIDLTLAYDTTLEGWSNALDLRDRETEGHTLRVTEATLRLARAMGMREEELVHLRRGALLHDIGKMGIPDSILLKPGPLTEEEWEIMRRHPVYAHKLLSPIPFLRPALDIPYAHHERWDGSGYPRGLVGDQIPLAARIFAVVDVWDALSSDRPYRPAWPEGQVRQHIREQAGSHFDPRVVEVFLSLQE